MVMSLGRLVNLQTFVGLFFVGLVVLLWAAVSGGIVGQIIAVFVAVLMVLGGIALMFLLWIKRMNQDIDTHRTEMREELDRVIEEMEED